MNQQPKTIKQVGQEFWKYRDLLKLLVSKNIKFFPGVTDHPPVAVDDAQRCIFEFFNDLELCLFV